MPVINPTHKPERLEARVGIFRDIAPYIVCDALTSSLWSMPSLMEACPEEFEAIQDEIG